MNGFLDSIVRKNSQIRKEIKLGKENVIFKSSINLAFTFGKWSNLYMKQKSIKTEPYNIYLEYLALKKF